MVSAYLNVTMDQTIHSLLPEITPRSNRFRTNQHNLLLRASAFRQQEQRNTGKQDHLKTEHLKQKHRNAGKLEHLKTGWSETKTQKRWKTGTLRNRNILKTGEIWKQKHLETGTKYTWKHGQRTAWKQKHWKTGENWKRKHLKTGASENRKYKEKEL